MNHWQYLMVMGACLLITLPLELLLGGRVYRQPRRLLRAIIPCGLVFLAWDAVAIARGHWTFDSRYVTGVVTAFEIPIEEVSFFIAVPICALLTFEVVKRWYPDA